MGAGVGMAVAASLGSLMPAANAANAAQAAAQRTTATPRAAVAGASRPMPVSIDTTDLGADFTLLAGAGCNVLALKGPQGALMVDGGLAANSQALLRAVNAATSTRRVATLINTHWHPAQTGSNEAVGKEGGLIIAHEVTKKYLARAVSSVDYE